MMDSAIETMRRARILAYGEIGAGDHVPGQTRSHYWAGTKPEADGPGWRIPWQMAFVGWCYLTAGFDIRKAFPQDWFNPVMVEMRARDLGLITTRPRPGDIVIYGYPSTGAVHAGIHLRWRRDRFAEAIEGNTWSTNDGPQNTGDGVHRKARSSAWIRGWVDMASLLELHPDALSWTPGTWSADDVARVEEALDLEPDGTWSADDDAVLLCVRAAVLRRWQTSADVAKVQEVTGIRVTGEPSPAYTAAATILGAHLNAALGVEETSWSTSSENAVHSLRLTCLER